MHTPKGILAAAIVLSLAGAGVAHAAVPTIDVMQIKTGQPGYCLTVFHGLKPERFSFRVKGILFNSFPKQHLILIESYDKRLKTAGIVAGMSGSPCFVGGRLAGALAYGPSWAKTAIAMLTPIGNMLEELKRPLRGIRKTPAAGYVHLPARTRRRLAWNDPRALLSRWSVPAPRPARLGGAVTTMRRLAVPLSVSGFDADSMRGLRRDVAPFGMEVVRGSGGSSEALKYYRSPSRFVAGGSIGVQMMRGAMSMNGTGTVTHVEGKKVLAFGHPMMNWGEHYIPVTSAWIHMFAARYASSYKMSTALGELGSLVLDRRACIMAHAGMKAPMIPVRVEVESPTGGKQNYDFEVFSNRIMSPRFIGYAMSSILSKLVPDVTDATIHGRFAFDTTGAGTIAMDDYIFSRRGASRGFYLSGTRGFKLMRYLLAQPFSKVLLKRIRVRLKVEHAVRFVNIERLRLSATAASPGEAIQVRVRLKRRYAKGSYVQTIPFRVPTGLPDGTILRLEVSGGLRETTDMAPPESIKDVLRVIRRWHHAKQLVLRVATQGEGTSLYGRIVTDLPGSVVDSLRSASSVKSQVVHRTSLRVIRNLSDVIHGKEYIYLRVQTPEN